MRTTQKIQQWASSRVHTQTYQWYCQWRLKSKCTFCSLLTALSWYPFSSIGCDLLLDCLFNSWSPKLLNWVGWWGPHAPNLTNSHHDHAQPAIPPSSIPKLLSNDQQPWPLSEVTYTVPEFGDPFHWDFFCKPPPCKFTPKPASPNWSPSLCICKIQWCSTSCWWCSCSPCA